jgi:Tfp pilus assembly protein PilO
MIKLPLDFIQRLSKEEKLIFFIAVSFAIIAFLDRVVFHVIFSKMATLDEQIKMQQTLIKKNLRILSEKDAILNLDKEYSVYSVQAKSQEEEISGILKEIENLASQAAVYMSEIKPAGLKDEKVFRKYSIILNCEATMEQIANFMYRMENSNTLFTIDNYSLAVKDKEKGTLKCTMTVSKVVVP